MVPVAAADNCIAQLFVDDFVDANKMFGPVPILTPTRRGNSSAAYFN
nr:MAG TPA: hypothetical protein [Caudoviricetes sp.]